MNTAKVCLVKPKSKDAVSSPMPSSTITAAAITAQYLQPLTPDIDALTILKELNTNIQAITKNNDVEQACRVLIEQHQILNTIFQSLVSRAASFMDNPTVLDAYIRLGLKAQKQSVEAAVAAWSLNQQLEKNKTAKRTRQVSNGS